MAHLTVWLLACVFASDQFITRGGCPICLGGGFQVRQSSRLDESEPCRMQKQPSDVEDATDVVIEMS